MRRKSLVIALAHSLLIYYHYSSDGTRWATRRPSSGLKFFFFFARIRQVCDYRRNILSTFRCHGPCNIRVECSDTAGWRDLVKCAKWIDYLVRLNGWTDGRMRLFAIFNHFSYNFLLIWFDRTRFVAPLSSRWDNKKIKFHRNEKWIEIDDVHLQLEQSCDADRWTIIFQMELNAPRLQTSCRRCCFCHWN